MTRLVNSTREKIVFNLLQNRFSKDILELANTWSVFAENVHAAGYTKALRVALMSADTGHYQDANHIRANIAGKGVVLYFNGWKNIPDTTKRYADAPAPVSNRLKFQHAVDRYENQNEIFKCDATHQLSSDFDVIANMQTTLGTLISTTAKEINAVLDSYHTIEKLVDAWPEVKAFIPAEVAPVPVNLPAVPIASLTEMLGLSK